MKNIPIDTIKNYFLTLQDKICQRLEQEDGKAVFLEDNWQRPQGGGGRTRVISDGDIFEKGGVNFSHIYGENLPVAATQKRPELANSHFQALGVSLVMHPQNPYIPTTHLNVRFFCAENEQGETHWWFGGGFDLTPYYGFIEDCIHWHTHAKAACDPFGKNVYTTFKQQCDEYFYLKHRQEARGIGGIFFDDLNEWGFDQTFAFIRHVGDQFISAYLPLVQQRKHQQYGTREKDFQAYRRGRYVEFNLIYDRGTLFGLQSGGRTESILISLPPAVNWRYNWHPEKDSAEAKLYEEFLPSRDWLANPII